MNKMAKSIKYQTLTVPSGKKQDLKKIKIDGVWSLTNDHDLKLRISGVNAYLEGKTLLFRGDIIKVTGSGFYFKVQSSDRIKGLRLRTLKLEGRWQADSNNRLIFRISGNRGRNSTLRLQGAWQINKRNELIYTYVKTDLKTKTKKERTLVFKGHWVLGSHILVYQLEDQHGSSFSFKASVQSRTLMAKDGAIRYQIGVKFVRKRTLRTRNQTVYIFGKWKLNRDLSVSFEIKHPGGKGQRADFTVEKVIARGNTVTMSLRSERGKLSGIEVLFYKKTTKNIEMFVSLGKHKSGIKALVGAKVKW